MAIITSLFSTLQIISLHVPLNLAHFISICNLCTSQFLCYLSIYDFFFLFQNYAAKHPDSQSLLDSVNNKYFYYTRTRGLFRICYPKERPPASAGKCLVSCQNTKLHHGMSLISCVNRYTQNILKQ